MSELNLEDLITNYLDTIYILSHSQGSVDSYRFAINRFKKFVQIKYEKPLEQIISEIKNNSMDRYQIFQDFVIYLDKTGKKPSSIKNWVMGAKGHKIDGYDSALWMHDDFGKVMKYSEYGNRDSQYGWEKDHIVTVDDGGSDDLSNLRPLNYKSNLARNRN